MSLAEPRRRRKNPMHSVNLSAPNHWTNDESKFGQRMLEKFGWSKGSGLGKNEQGISEIIKVQHKVTPTGLGFIANNADDWFKAGEDYSRLLSQLTKKFDEYQTLSTESNDNLKSKKSLEQNSLNSRSRVHYHKFTKGKDLTQYKSEELACIVGKGERDNQQCSKNLNMIEYFKTKRESKKCKLDKNNSLNNENSVDVDEDNERTTDQEGTEISEYVDKSKINISPNKIKCELKQSNEIEMLPSNKCDNFEVKKKKKKLKAQTTEDLVDTEHTEEKFTQVTSGKDLKQVKKTKLKKMINENEDDFEHSKKKKSKHSKLLSDESQNEVEQAITKKPEVLTSKDDTDNLKIEHDSLNFVKTNEQKPFVQNSLTHKYQNLVDLLIENSSAGKKYSKDLPNPAFENKMKEFSDSVKHQFAAFGSIETKPKDKESTSVKLKTLNPDDTNFIRDFEIQKSKVLENIKMKQELTKYINEKSMFVAKHGDVLFFGSNINDIKGYGEWCE